MPDDGRARVEVPFFDLTRQHASLEPELSRAASRVIASGRYVLGSEVAAFEQELATQLGCQHVIGVSSGSDALVLALAALGVGAGDEVVTTTYSFVATAESILRAGARPVLVDIDPDTFDLDISAVADVITPRTRAVLPVHLFGRLADLERLLPLTARHGIACIEDAAQAIGTRRGALQAGAAGTAGCFSFFPSKTLGALGDGGAVTCRDPRLAARLRELRRHGVDETERAQRLGGNYRLDELQAGLLRVKLEELPRFIARRRELVARYRDGLVASELVGSLAALRAGDAALTLCSPELSGEETAWSQFVVRARDRDALRQRLAARGIGSHVYYRSPLHHHPLLAPFVTANDRFPEAERLATEALALPLFPELSNEELDRVVGEVAAFYRGR